MNRKEEIRKELAEISPFLAELGLRPAFKVPKGYFEELPETILESVSPLADLKKASAFSVPKDYFASLPDLVLDRVAPKHDTETIAEPVVKVPQSSWLDELINSVAVLFQPRYALRLAAAAVVLIGSFVFIQNYNATNNNSLAAVDNNIIEAYGISLDDLDDDDLSFLLEGEIAETELNLDEDLDDATIDELLNDLDEISEEDLKGFL